MCVGIPMQVRACDDITATASDGERDHLIDMSLTGSQEPGTWILTFLGTAREVLPEAEALKIRAALRGLAALMDGGDLGDAFADLDNREPELPPHLKAALANGETTA